MRSVVVVFPASMCAEIPMFRYRSIGVFLGMMFTSSVYAASRPAARVPRRVANLESKVREGPIRLGHPMHFLAPLHGPAASFRSLDQLAGQTQRHRLLAALLGRLAQPAHRQRHPAYRPHLDRDLVVGATDAPALDLDCRLHVAQGLGKDLHRVLPAFLLDLREGTVHDAFRYGLLAVKHDDVDELGDVRIGELRIRQDLALRNLATTRHWLPLFSVESWPRPTGGHHGHRRAPCERARTYSYCLLRHPVGRGDDQRITRTSAAWHRTWSDFACGPSRPACPASHARCDSAPRADP